MSATPQKGSMVFVGMSGMTYTKQVYISDVNNALLRWDAGAGAGSTSPQDWMPPEPVMLTDFSLVTGTVDTTSLQLVRNSIPTGDFLQYTLHLNTNPLRPQLRIPFGMNQRVQAIEKT